MYSENVADNRTPDRRSDVGLGKYLSRLVLLVTFNQTSSHVGHLTAFAYVLDMHTCIYSIHIHIYAVITASHLWSSLHSHHQTTPQPAAAPYSALRVLRCLDYIRCDTPRVLLTECAESRAPKICLSYLIYRSAPVLHRLHLKRTPTH